MFNLYFFWYANTLISLLDICPGCNFPTDSLLTQETDSENCLDCLYKKKNLKVNFQFRLESFVAQPQIQYGRETVFLKNVVTLRTATVSHVAL